MIFFVYINSRMKKQAQRHKNISKILIAISRYEFNLLMKIIFRYIFGTLIIIIAI